MRGSNGQMIKWDQPAAVQSVQRKMERVTTEYGGRSNGSSSYLAGISRKGLIPAKLLW